MVDIVTVRIDEIVATQASTFFGSYSKIFMLGALAFIIATCAGVLFVKL